MTAPARVLVAMLAWGALAFGATYPWGILAARGRRVRSSASWAACDNGLRSRRQLRARWPCRSAAVGSPSRFSSCRCRSGAFRAVSPASRSVADAVGARLRRSARRRHSALDRIRWMTADGAGAVRASGRSSSSASRAPSTRGASRASSGTGRCFGRPARDRRRRSRRAATGDRSRSIYGFWKPIVTAAIRSDRSINRNHFAGWMVMALSGRAGLRAAVDRRRRGRARRRRGRAGCAGWRPPKPAGSRSWCSRCSAMADGARH